MLHGIELKGSSLQPINEIVCFVSEEFLFLRVIFCLLTSGRSFGIVWALLELLISIMLSWCVGSARPIVFETTSKISTVEKSMSPENKAFGQTGCFGAVVFRRYIKKDAHASMQSNWNQGKHEGIKVWSVLMHIVVLYVLYVLFFCCAIFNWGGL